MRPFKAGEKLDLLTRHQDTRRFVPREAVGEVVKGTDGHYHKMMVRVYGDWRPKKGYLHEFLRVTDRIWLERIGVRVNRDGTTNVPQVHEIIGTLTDQEFQRRRDALAD
jgi:hypothetical protein